MTVLALAAAVVTNATSAKASQTCELVRGELDAWNGTPSLRIQSGNHLIGIVESAAHPLLPAISTDVDFNHSVIGLFTVCKLGQAAPNGMIYAWLKQAQILKILPAP